MTQSAGCRDIADSSTVRRIGSPILGNLFFVLVADRQQHRFGINQVTAFFAVIFKYACLDD